ncbi:MAG: hypothetical protein R3244_09660 [Thermoanaerobaculia bacterium]|nr:hypothetical protein [Thermoanaerobaculia bacterium]
MDRLPRFWAPGKRRARRALERERAERLREIDDRLSKADELERGRLETERQRVVDLYAQKRRELDGGLF